jgi:hypothetical protein
MTITTLDPYIIEIFSALRTLNPLTHSIRWFYNVSITLTLTLTPTLTLIPTLTFNKHVHIYPSPNPNSKSNNITILDQKRVEPDHSVH